MATSGLDLAAQITADATVWVRETQKAAKSMQALANSAQQSANSITKSYGNAQRAGGRLSKFVRTTLAVAFGIQLSNAVTRATFALKAFVKESIFGAARTEQMASVLNMLGRRVGYSSDQIETFTHNIRKSGIELGIAQNTLAEFIRNNMDAAQAVDLARVAQDAAVISNSNSSATLDRLIYGIARQNSLLLRNAGVQVQVGQAVAEYAAEIGKATDSLTNAERTQAVLNAALAEGKKLSGAYAKSLEEPVKKLGSLVRIVNDIKISIGNGLYPAFKQFVNEGLDPFVQWIKASLAEGSQLNTWISNFGQSMANAMAAFIAFTQDEDTQKTLQGIGESLITIAESAGRVAAEVVKVGGAITAWAAWNVAVQGAAVALKALAAILEPLLPVITAFVLALGAKAVLGFAAGIGAAAVAKIKYAAATWSAVTALAAETQATVAATAATLGLSAALKTILPLLVLTAGAFVLMEIFKGANDEGKKLEATIDSINSALYDQNGLLPDNQEAWRNWLGNRPFQNIDSDVQQLVDTLGLTSVELQEFVRIVQESGETGEYVFPPLLDYLKSLNTGYDLATSQAENFVVALRLIGDAQKRTFQRTSWEQIQRLLVDSLEPPSGDMVSEWQSSADRTLELLQQFAVEAGLAADIASARSIDWEAWLNSRSAAEAIQFAEQFGEITATVNEEVLAYNKVVHEAALQTEELEVRALALSGAVEELGISLAEAERRVVTAEKDFQNLNDRIKITSGLTTDLIGTTDNLGDSVDAMAQVMFQAANAQRATGDEAEQLESMIAGVQGAAFANAEAIHKMNQAADIASDATEILRGELQKARDWLVQAGQAAGYNTDELLRMYDMMMTIDGAPPVVVDVVMRFGGMNTQSISAVIEALTAVGVPADIPFIAHLEKLLSLLSMPEITEAPWSGRGGRGLEETVDLWEQILGAIERSAAAVKTGTSAISGYISATERVERIDEEINALLDQRNKLQEDGNRFQREYELSVLRQARALLDLEATYERLVARQQELTPEALEDQQAAIDDLVAKAHEVTAVERGLIAQGFITEAEAAADVTAAEATEIERLANALSAAERRYAAGIITEAEYTAAQDALTQSIADAIAPSQELIDAQERLAEMQAEAETIALDLAIAEEELALASEDAAAALSAEEAVKQQIAAIDERLRDLALEQVEAVRAQEAAYMELARSAPEVVKALEAIDDMGGTLADQFALITEHIREMMEEARQAFPEFDEYRQAVELDRFYKSIEEHGLGNVMNYLAGLESVPAMANGGVVKKPQLVLAGEAGPEAIVPLSKLGAMGGGGSTYNINISAGVSDPAAVSEAVVEALREYERANGPVPVTTESSMYTSSAST